MSAPSRKPPPRRAAAAASSVQNPAPRRSGLTSAAAKINSTIRPAPQGPTVVDPKPHPHKLPDASSPEHLRALRVSAWARDALGLGLVDTAVFWAEVALSLLGGGPAHIVAPVPEKEPNAKAEAFAAKSYIVTTLMDALLMKCEFERIVLLSADVKTYGDVLRDAKFRSITVQALIKLDRHDEAMAHLNAPDNADASAVFHHPATSFIPFQPKSQVYFMKGTVQKTLGNNDEAKKMWLEALKADARCFDAFQALIHGCLLTFDEESRLLQSLAIRKCVDESDVELVTLLYQVQLKVYGKMPQISADLKKLEDFYGLKNNATIMYARAVLLAMQSRPSEAVEVTERLVNCCVVHHIEKFTSILKVSPTHVQTIFLHTSLLAMMQTRQSSNALFLHAHSLVNAYPALAASWYAVGCYYLSVSKTSAAREAFEKACRIDPGCGEAWVAHGHALSLEGSSEEAVHAYSIAWKSYSGIHTPSLFIGMQYAQLGKSKIGEEYLKIASEICSTDPLVENEFGVLAFNRKEFVGISTSAEN
ncbi:anaphase promoting complex subunit cdc16 [Entophlyctis sp. JEL0112]|nr:anaphase promoting complex subunit cdc16 [Entophlyctis sp. JEL0112]